MKDGKKTKARLKHELARSHRVIEGSECTVFGRKMTEGVLRDQEAILHAITLTTRDAIIMIDDLGRISFWNTAAERILGYNESEALGRDLHLLLAPERYHVAYNEGIQHFFNTGQGKAVDRILELHAVRKDGTEIPVELSLSAVRLRGQWHAVGIMRDMTDRKQAEDALRASAEKYRGILGSMYEAYFEVDLRGNFIFFNDAAVRMSGYSREELLGMNYRNCSPPDTARYMFEVFNKVHITGEAESMVDCKVIHKDGSLRENELSVWPMKDSSGVIVGFHSLMRDVTEHKRAERALKESEKEYRTIFENTGTGTIIIDQDTTILLANSNFEEFTDISKQEMEGKMSWVSFIDESDREMMKRYHELRRMNPASAPSSYECRIRNRTGESRDIFINVALIPGTNKSVASFMDITYRKSAEDALRRSEERYRLLAENVDDVIWTMDPSGKFTYISPSIEHQRGYTSEEAMELPIERMLRPASAEILRRKLEETVGGLQEGRHVEAISLELEGLHKNGSIVWIDVNCRAIFNSSGEFIGFLGVSRDISKRKLAEEALQISELKYKDIFDNAMEGIFQTTPQGRYQRVNPALARMFGYDSPDEMISEITDIGTHEYIDPTDREKMIGKLLEKGMVRDYEVQVRRKDGSLFWISMNVRAVIDEYGDLRYMEGTNLDITERKLAEEKLRELSLTDELTGLNNRRGFVMLANQQMKSANRFKQSLVLIYTDLDKMKWINDSLGHKEGDRALMDTANILRCSFRASDIIARLGGDEFVGLAVETGDTTSEAILSRLQENLKAHNIQGERPYTLSISSGVARYDPENPCSLDELLDHADNMMYETKQSKKMIRDDQQ